MDRRDFIKSITASTAALHTLAAHASSIGIMPSIAGLMPASAASLQGHTKLVSFTRNAETWTVYEDLRVRDGVLTFVCSDGNARVLRKTAEATSASEGPQYLGLDLKEIGMADADLLADKLLAHGDPSEEEVRRAVPPMNSDHSDEHNRNFRPGWNTFVGTRECNDTMPVFPSGNTRTYHPQQHFKELTPQTANQRNEGLVGGWMPAVRKVIPGEQGAYYEVVVFGDVLAHDRFIVQTWHRTAHIQNGAVLSVHYGYSYPSYTRRRQEPQPEEFYRGMLEFAEYWESQTQDLAAMTLPDTSWTGYDSLLLREGADGAPRWRVPEVRLRVRRLPGYLHHVALREPREWSIPAGEGRIRQLLLKLHRCSWHDQHARPGDSAVWPHPLPRRSLRAAYRRHRAAASGIARRSRQQRVCWQSCTTRLWHSPPTIPATACYTVGASLIRA